MTYTHLLFDLDGTITDSGEGIRRGVAYALRGFGIEETDTQKLNRFIGPPLTDAFSEFYGLSTSDAERALELYREYYLATGIFENAVYDGVREALSVLREAGLTLTVATSKPEVMARTVLSHFDLLTAFDHIRGSELDGTNVKKSDVIRLVIGHYPNLSPKNCLMIGDRHHDMQGAAACGVEAVGVLWGYGSADELSSAGAKALAKTPRELCDYILTK